MSISYRSDIDGLRAVAIISVIIFHMFPSHLPGGFVGVDVFFVLSGYLITSIILKEIKSQKFSILNFYIKRAVRILPSLFCMFGLVLILGYFFFLPDEFSSLGRHISSGASFISNFTLLREVGYFDLQGEFKPLLHLWSLAIEEQFYIFFPLLLIISFKKKMELKVVLTVFFLSLLFCIYKTAHSPEFAFFSPLTRVWEILIGSILALSEFHKITAKKNEHLISLIGFLACLASILLFSNNMRFPGYWALLPSIGTALIIIAGPKAIMNRSVLSYKPVVYVGLISYPLYLFHWPLLSFVRILFRNESTTIYLFSAIFIAVILSASSYHLLEKRIKNKVFVEKKTLSIWLLFLLFAFLGLGQLIKKKVIESYSSKQGLEEIISAAHDWEYPGNMNRKSYKSFKYYVSPGTYSKYVMILGDSNAEQYYPRIKHSEGSKGYLFVTRGGCVPIPGYVYPKKMPEDCIDMVQNAIGLAQEKNVKRVIISASWLAYFSGAQDWSLKDEKEIRRFKDMLFKFKANNIEVILVQNIPYGSMLNPRLMVKRSISLIPTKISYEKMLKDEFLKQYGHIYKVIEEAAKGSGAVVINPLNFLCDEKNCPAFENKEPIYKDSDHLRSKFVRQKVKYLDPFLFD